MNYLPTLAEFRILRNRYQSERRALALPQLKAQESALKREIALLRRQRDAATKHDKQIIENNLLPLTWRQQDISGQIAVIEEAVAVGVLRKSA